MKHCGTDLRQDFTPPSDSSDSPSIRKFECKEYARLREEAPAILMKRGRGLSFTALGPHLEAEGERNRLKRRLKKKSVRPQNQLEETAMAEASIDLTADGGNLFIIDVNPAPVDPEKLVSPHSEEDGIAYDGGALVADTLGSTPSGLSQATRRRIKEIYWENARLQHKLGALVDSDEEANESQKQLEEQIEQSDIQQDCNMEGDSHIRNRNGKLLASLEEDRVRQNTFDGPLRTTRTRRVMTSMF